MTATTGETNRLRVFGTLCVLVFLVNFGRVAFAPLLEPLMAAFDVGEATAGLVATLAWLGSALTRVPVGYVLTRVARHRVVLGSGLLLVVGAAVSALAPSIEAIGLGALLLGLASGGYFVAANPLVSELYPQRVGRAIGVHGTAAQLAAVAAPAAITAAVLLDSWRAAFVGLGVVAALASASLARSARSASLPSAGTEDRDFRGAVRAQWPIVLAGVVVLGIAGFVWNGMFNFYVSYLTETRGFSTATAGSLLTVAFVAGVPAFLFAGRLADRFRHVPLLVSLVGAFAVCVYALTLARGLLAVGVATVAVGLAIHSIFPTIDTYMLSSLPDRHRASAYSAYSGTMMLVQATGSVVLGTLIEAGLAYDDVFRTYAVGLLGLVAVLAVLYRAGRLPTGGSADS